MSSRVLPVLALFIAIGIFFAYVAPNWNGPIAELKAQIASDNETLQAAEQYAKAQNDLATQRNAIDAESLKRLETFLPNSVDNVGLILDINALAARSGISISDIDIVTIPGAQSAPAAADDGISAARTNPIGSADLSLSAVGTYKALQTFLIGVEKSARLLDVRDINVKGSETGVYNYQMIVRLYWLR